MNDDERSISATKVTVTSKKRPSPSNKHAPSIQQQIVSSLHVIYRVFTLQARSQRIAPVDVHLAIAQESHGDPVDSTSMDTIIPLNDQNNTVSTIAAELSESIDVSNSEAKSSKLNLKFHGTCHIGAGDPPLKDENQDTIVMEEMFGGIPNCFLFAVYDGHGRHGAIISQFCANFVTNWMAEHVSTLSDRKNETLVTSLLENAFQACEDALSTDAAIGFRVKMSGSTATVALILKNVLYVAGLGDSRAILVDRSGQPSRLTTDHRPELGIERSRIEEFGGCVRERANLDLPSDSLSNEAREALKAKGEKLGPLRVWVNKDKYKGLGLVGPGPGLMITRSFGDFVAKAAGCSAIPDITRVELNPRINKHVVLGSDGIWDMIPDEEVANSVHLNRDLDLIGPSSELLRVALQRWNAQNAADNVALIIVAIQED